MLKWLWKGILWFGSPVLLMTMVACGDESDHHRTVILPSPVPSEDLPDPSPIATPSPSPSPVMSPSPSPSPSPTQPDQLSQANLEALVDSLSDDFMLEDSIEIPAQSFSFPARLLSLTITITDPDSDPFVDRLLSP